MYILYGTWQSTDFARASLVCVKTRTRPYAHEGFIAPEVGQSGKGLNVLHFIGEYHQIKLPVNTARSFHRNEETTRNVSATSRKTRDRLPKRRGSPGHVPPEGSLRVGSFLASSRRSLLPSRKGHSLYRPTFSKSQAVQWIKVRGVCARSPLPSSSYDFRQGLPQLLSRFH